MKDKRVLVSWSGGVDSTYLIENYLGRGYKVDSVYTKIQNNDTKIVRELAAINKMQDYFKPYAYTHLGDVGIDLNLSPINFNIELAQPLLFLTTLFYALKPEHTEVAIGYILNDCAISYINDIQKTWKSFQGNCTTKLPPLVFPLSKTDKVQTYNGLPSEIKELVTWCESAGEEDRCGECHPCKKMKYYGLFPGDVDTSANDWSSW